MDWSGASSGVNGGGDVWFGYVDMLCCRTKYCYYIIFGVLSLIFAVLLYYKNVSFVMTKLLLREPNVVIILMLALCNWSIDIVLPDTSTLAT